MKFVFSIGILTFGVVLFVKPSYAQSAREIFVDGIVHADAIPENIKVFFRNDTGREFFVEGSAVKIPGTDSDWVLGAALSIPASAKSVAYSAAGFSATNAVVFLPWKKVSVSDADLFDGNIRKLRENVLQIKKTIEGTRELMGQTQLNAEAVRREMDAVEGGGVLRRYEFEAEALSVEKVGVEMDCDSLEHAVARMKLQPPPISSAKREVDLQQQIALFAGLAKNAETGEQARREQSEMDVEQARALIDATEGEDEELLVRKLEMLKERRALLEDR